MSQKHRVVVNNGFGQFHMARLAENLERSGGLELFLTGAYPPAALSSTLRRTQVPALNRLVGRKIEVPDDKVRSFWPGEVPHQVAQYARHKGWERISDFATGLTLDSYRHWATRSIKGSAADVYHYRAGMGGASVEAAKNSGAVAICDHSIVHPRLLPGLVDGSGRIEDDLSELWRRVEEDIHNADHLIVNSDFVAETCIEAGLPAERISVAYTGVDPMFLAELDQHALDSRWNRPQTLFAGTLERRKGIDVALQAAKETAGPGLPWLLMGNWENDSKHLASELGEYVQHVSRASRHVLAQTLAETAIFVFPTRAEGSARVVAEALCAGCYVITTRNAGSIVRDGIDGCIVGVDDADGVTAAIQEYLGMSTTERRERSTQTSAHARRRLSEDSYSGSVAHAYDLARA